MIRQNRYMFDAARMLCLPIEFKDSTKLGPPKLAIWDSVAFRFIESDWKVLGTKAWQKKRF